jgi:hypothetical protein
MRSQSDNAKQVASNFIGSFNDQDHAKLADTLNYPQIRLAMRKFYTTESAEEFIQHSQKAEIKCIAEGWDHTVIESMDSVPEGDDKVHLAIRNHRINKAGVIYNSFETLWIATLINEHWGIQFRSSYLR